MTQLTTLEKDNKMLLSYGVNYFYLFYSIYVILLYYFLLGFLAYKLLQNIYYFIITTYYDYYEKVGLLNKLTKKVEALEKRLTLIYKYHNTEEDKLNHYIRSSYEELYEKYFNNINEIRTLRENYELLNNKLYSLNSNVELNVNQFNKFNNEIKVISEKVDALIQLNKINYYTLSYQFHPSSLISPRYLNKLYIPIYENNNIMYINYNINASFDINDPLQLYTCYYPFMLRKKNHRDQWEYYFELENISNYNKMSYEEKNNYQKKISNNYSGINLQFPTHFVEL